MGSPSENFGPTVALFDMTLEEAFPDVKSGHKPTGTKVLVQIRATKEETRGGIIIPDEARATIAQNTQVAKVIALGPMAFKNPNTGVPWPEGPWFAVGDYVRCPKFGSDRFEVPVPGQQDEMVMFAIYDHLQFSAVIDDPLEVRTFI